MEKEIYTAVLADCEVTFGGAPEILRAFLDNNSEWLEIEDLDTNEKIILNKTKVIYFVRRER